MVMKLGGNRMPVRRSVLVEIREGAVMDEGHVEDATIVAIRELALGVAVIVVAAFAAPVLSPSPPPAGRALTLSVVAGVLSALFTSWQARLGVVIASVVTFVGFIGSTSGALTGEQALWAYTPLIGLATVLGHGYRVIAQATTPAVSDDSAGSPG